MKVYRFLCPKYGIKTLKEHRLKISNILELNDPFEFFSADLGNKQFRQAMAAVKQEMALSRGIICFSKTWSNPLLWSHYADKHKGICLGIEFPSENLTRMRYKKLRVPVSSDIDEHSMQKILTTKFNHWRYEQEYRAFLSLDEADPDNNYYLDFSDQVQLKEVIVGVNSTLTRQNILDALDTRAKTVRIFKARPAFRTFTIVRNMNPHLWI